MHSVGVDELSSAGAAASGALVKSTSRLDYQVMVGGGGLSALDSAITASAASPASVSSEVITTSAGEAILHYRPNIIQIISSNSSCSSSSNSTSSLTTQTTDPFDCKCGHN